MFACPVLCNNSSSICILDSGATHHITPYLNLVLHPTHINHDIHLRNGNVSLVTHIGIVNLSNDIQNRDVLVVPTFQCNLIPISKLTMHTSFTVHFSTTNCLLQDPVLMMEKEIGDLTDGLYKLHTTKLRQLVFSVNSTTCYATSKVCQWHWRIGHPSLNVLEHIKCLPVLLV